MTYAFVNLPVCRVQLGRPPNRRVVVLDLVDHGIPRYALPLTAARKFESITWKQGVMLAAVHDG
eukprot:m.157336 g.157336  ORF g.157336 m.157336 type:complete len:64 (-) comp17967_c0_seq1:3261-3452(-)